MDHSPQLTDELHELLWQLRAGAASPEQLSRLEHLVCEDRQARAFYIRYMHLCADLHWNSVESAEREERNLEIWRFGDLEIGDSGMGGGDSGFGIRDFHVPNLQISKSPNQQIPSLSTLHSPLSTNFVGGPVFSYIAATLILGVMLLSAWAYKITHDYAPAIVNNSRKSTTSGNTAPQRPELVFVGRVTGMKDCRWSDPKTETYAGAAVPLGRKYALSSGLMEITYASGAKVILEGPCRYEVESSAGGFLALGKLTAKVESGEWRGERGEKRKGMKGVEGMKGMKAEGHRADNHQISKSPNLQIPNPSPLSTLHSPLFSVRTPTAVVTDMGTEFGVSVDENGNTTSHVFQGQVVVQSLAAASTRREPSPENIKSQIPNPKSQITLSAGESGRVEKDTATGGTGKASGTLRIVTGGKVGTLPKFVRRLYEPPKYLDLLDIVAGGNGLGHRREHGIDPISGRYEPSFAGLHRDGDRQFWPVTWHKLIDGVFVPQGGAEPVQLDSAGHAFDGFPTTDGATYGSIWSRAADIAPENSAPGQQHWPFVLGRDERLMPGGRGLLGMHGNQAITFGLAAMRGSYPRVRPERFQAKAGLGDARSVDPAADGMADFWVFIDGQLKFKRLGVRYQDGAIGVDVEIGPQDRFLTLAVTDGGNTHAADWAVFGDPVLLLTPIE